MGLRRFGVASDLHLSKYPNDKLDSELNISKKLLGIIRALKHMIQYCRERDIKNIVLAGDLLHNKSIVHSIAQKYMLDLIRENSDITFWVIDGNHDLSGKGSDSISSLEPLMDMPNVNWISKNAREVDGILFVPYSNTMIDDIVNNKADMLISHFGLSEATLNSGISIRTNISTKDLRGKYKTVILGHYHKPQEIIKKDLKVYYAGSLIQLDWGEKNEEKRFLIVDREKDTIESIPSEGYLRYCELEITNENYKSVLRQAKELKEQGHHVNIRKKEKMDTKEIEDTFRVIDNTEEDITNRGITATMTLTDKLDKYMEIKEIPEGRRKAYREVAIQLIKGETK